MDTFWIILVGSLVAVNCALLGCFLVLRKMAMVGDAVSHAVLPGIIIAYLFVQSRDSIPMLLGASVFGVVVTILIETLHKRGKMPIDAAIGLSFTWLFALGVILISLFAGESDLDQDCVLYGKITYVSLNVWMLNGVNMGPMDVWILGSLFVLIVLFIWVSYRGLLITTFDETFAASLGISTIFWHYALMSMVSLTTVLSFYSVGAILVVAFLIGPAAVAYLLTDKLQLMLLYALIAGVVAAISGYYLAVWVQGSEAGAMATMVGVEFLLVFLFSPKNGFFTSKINKTTLDKFA
jgi:manganese/zinc/iron transport system permease protein